MNYSNAKTPTLREQLGYASDAALIAELREVLAVNAATQAAAAAAAAAHPTQPARRSPVKRRGGG